MQEKYVKMSRSAYCEVHSSKVHGEHLANKNGLSNRSNGESPGRGLPGRLRSLVESLSLDRMGVQELEAAVLELDTEQLAEFEKWFSGFRNAKWDAEFAEDAVVGRLDALAGRAIASFGQGLNRPL